MITAAPPLRRRLASLVYETVLLFGVTAFSTSISLLVAVLFQQFKSPYFQQATATFTFFVFGLYFIWLWTHGGQTLPMRTWRIRVVAADGSPLGPWRALGRYLLAWLWVLPGWAAASLLHVVGWQFGLALALNCLVMAIAALIDKDRQFLHDRLAGTRLIVAA
ncbi:MAG: RDD family protein [Burkholderiaceae bacterium]|nr:RDD family protein [Burkholderiaceae bacterium]